MNNTDGRVAGGSFVFCANNIYFLHLANVAWVTVQAREISHLEISPECQWFTDHGSVRLRMERTSCPFLGGDGSARNLLSNKIQVREDIGSQERQTSSAGAMDGSGQLPRLGRQPRERRQLRRQGSQRQQLERQQPQQQHRSVVRQAVIPPSIVRNSRFAREFLLTLFRGLNPPAEHPTDLVEISFDEDILLVVNRLHIFQEAHAYPHEVELHACFL